tara:strand:- start:258 stop:1115 length:858 start_codon:yes stop_codon:yes gene_type:complete
MLTKDLINLAKGLIPTKNFRQFRYESQILISNLLNRNLLQVIIDQKIKVSKKNQKKFLKQIYFRSLGKPISKIVGIKEFYSREFFVSSFTLDPRPESELIIDYIKTLKFTKNKEIKILDLGTGTGCLIITLVLELRKINKIIAVAVDRCQSALDLAIKNAIKFNLNNHINFVKSDWFANLNGKFDIIISNPPYIRSKEIELLDNTVKSFDPFIALDGGKDGLEAYKQIANNSKKFLNENGYVCLEIGFDQKEKVTKIFVLNKFEKICELRDLSNKDRVLVFKNKI